MNFFQLIRKRKIKLFKRKSNNFFKVILKNMLKIEKKSGRKFWGKN